MSIRSDIINNLVLNLKRINGGIDTTPGVVRIPYQFKSVIDTVKRRFLYLDQINAFPMICIYGEKETRVHIGSGIKYGILQLRLRGYIMGGENSVLLSEDLADDIEYIIQALPQSSEYCNDNIVDAKVISLQTDEGLFSPYGLCDLSVEISYQQEINI